MTINLTPELERDIQLLKDHYPFRIVYVYIDENGTQVASAATSRRPINNLLRKGLTVAIVK